METTRQIAKVFESQPTLEGAGVHLNRVFGYAQVPLFDPFLMMDDFHSAKPEEYLAGFPWHPHRGIETVTYILQGSVEHRDSLGNHGQIGPGDVQWMTAGNGIIHEEMPKASSSRLMWGIQLWVNLPASHKMMPPRYQDIPASEIPEIDLKSGIKARVLCGRIDHTQGPVKGLVRSPVFVDLQVPAATVFSLPVAEGHTVLTYLLEGTVYFGNPAGTRPQEPDFLDGSGLGLCTSGSVALFNPSGTRLVFSTTREPVRFLLLSGEPLREPVAWGGPIVMNTEAELALAFKEYQQGNFIKHA